MLSTLKSIRSSTDNERYIEQYLKQCGTSIPGLAIGAPMSEQKMFALLKSTLATYQEQITGLGNIECKLVEKGYEDLAFLISNMAFRQVTPHEILQLSIDLDKLFNKAPSK